MFTTADVRRLIHDAVSNPHIDALVALQARRGDEESPLFGIMGLETGDKVTLEGPLSVDSGHFGLSLIKVEKLRQLAKPWFLAIPDAQGSWQGDDRTDADIYFWRKWRAAGNTVFVDPDVMIGHLQLMVTDFDDDGKCVHIHVDQWKEKHGLLWK